MNEHSRTIFLPPEGDSEGRHALRALVWPELVARLDAQRDMRAVLRGRGRTAAASFNGGAAEWLAQAVSDEAGCKRDVNPDALSDSNHTGANFAQAADGAAEGDREIL